MTIAQDIHPLIESNSDFDNPRKLRASLQENGYLYLRGLGLKKKILELRRVFLTFCREAGWLDPKAELMEGRWGGAGPFAENDPEYMAVYKKIVHDPLFNELPADRFYMDLMARLVDGPAFMHRMHIGRISFPQNTTQTTPPHQDWQYIRGTPQTYTLWSPLGDIPPQVGGLKVLRGSHRRGFIEHVINAEHKFAGWGLGERELEQTTGDEWHTTSYTLGDLVLFHSHTVHGAMPNTSGDTLRLSVDNRYQRQGDEHGDAAVRTHHDL